MKKRSFFLWVLAGFPLFLMAQLPPLDDTASINICAKFWKNQAPITNVLMTVYTNSSVVLNPIASAGPDTANSCLLLDVPLQTPFPGINYFFEAKKDDNPLNGISVIDLELISRHILGIEPLPTYAVIAADANLSGSVTTFDIVELRKLLLGIYTNLPVTTQEWRFVDALCMFNNPINPFGGITCPTYMAFTDGQNFNMIGMKIGDVDGDANLSSSYAGPSTSDTILFRIPPQTFTAGDTFLFPVIVDDNAEIGGLQMAFSIDTGTLAVQAFFDGALDVSQNDFSIFPGEFRMVYYRPNYLSVGGDTLFWVKMAAKKNGALQNALNLDALRLKPILTSPTSGQRILIQLTYDNMVDAPIPVPEAELLPPAPNPFTDRTFLDLNLRRGSPVWLEVFDPAGRRTYSRSFDLPAGRHRLEIPAEAVPGGGLAFYRVMAGGQAFGGRVSSLRSE